MLKLKTLINNTEQRISDYKAILKDIHKSPLEYPEWYKVFVRETKNSEQINLKEYVRQRANGCDVLEIPFNV